ncbi:acetyltransferase (GNAT) family protein [Micromonospora pisi]|uniref:Acetyltransferase (GNAT) family protein n=1 Tax=Micromonospora pisi TaxID=589240 RepID=A0A495JUE3_9ACTN|nr:GNAT family N-acetyltransferase [Micromonospora pisi]RKR92155.1 acetyltransferase (GNAT) family protein [Micromonospora pisi]
MRIRPYRPGDFDAVGDICIRTADAGEDASGSYVDPDILPDIFAHPYAHLEPDLAFVLDDSDSDSDSDGDGDGDGTGRAVGYVLGTSDTARFVRRFRDEWLPRVGDRYPAPAGEPSTPDAVMARLLHTPERMLLPELVDYPAHLHIDVLPGYQRAGHGRVLIETLTGALRRTGVPGLHLGMITTNRKARAFYDRLGFHVVEVADPGPLTYLGLRF